MVYAQMRKRPRELDIQNSNLGQTIRPRYQTKTVKLWVLDLAISVDHIIKLKEGEKRDNTKTLQGNRKIYRAWKSHR